MKIIKMITLMIGTIMFCTLNVYADTHHKGIYINVSDEVFSFAADDYVLDEVNDYINNVSINTTIENYRDNIKLIDGYTVVVETKSVNSEDVLYTGGKTTIMHGSEIYKEYVNVVKGDIDGDAKINSADLLRVRLHLLGKNIITGAYFLASDIDNNSTLNSADLLRIRLHLLGKKEIG